ncbi:hypothetical protein JCM30394_21180 [Deferrisoma palaeochoriense]
MRLKGQATAFFPFPNRGEAPKERANHETTVDLGGGRGGNAGVADRLFSVPSLDPSGAGPLPGAVTEAVGRKRPEPAGAGPPPPTTDKNNNRKQKPLYMFGNPPYRRAWAGWGAAAAQPQVTRGLRSNGGRANNNPTLNERRND